MKKPRYAVLYAPGTNCHEETAFAVEYVGGEAAIVSVRSLLEGSESLSKFDGLVVPGGFSWGDHLGAGRILAIHLMSRLSDALRDFAAAGKPILGICNGNQVLVETGLLPCVQVGRRGAALLQNTSAKFESRLSTLVCPAGWAASRSFMLRGLEGRTLRVPVAHGEGRYYAPDGTSTLPAFLYVGANGLPTEEYPHNPAGSPGGIAGTIDPSGMVLGMMPHPERAMLPWHESQDGLAIMRNLIP